MSKKDEYFDMMESQIKKWDAEVDKLRARSDQVSADARAKYDEQLKAMRANRDAAPSLCLRQTIPTPCTGLGTAQTMRLPSP